MPLIIGYNTKLLVRGLQTTSKEPIYRPNKMKFTALFKRTFRLIFHDSCVWEVGIKEGLVYNNVSPSDWILGQTSD